ncbi:hypothetical protein G9A89_012598 [Geosiphon pyriformis]|nr:hypothetical protein G9A89_012598 [Geosiphon pyriformis]
MTKKDISIDFSIVFVGHGIGGAYAALAALSFNHLLYQERRQVGFHTNIRSIGVVTFGAPRIGNFHFVNLVSGAFKSRNVYRVTHSNDWVSREFLPKGKFVHYKPEYWLAKGECDCSKYSSDRFYVHKCDSKGNESQECNLGTVDSESENNLNPNMGPFLGIIFANCTGIKNLFFNHE